MVYGETNNTVVPPGRSPPPTWSALTSRDGERRPDNLTYPAKTINCDWNLRLVATRVFNVRLLHSFAFSKKLFWLPQTNVITLKMQTNTVENACRNSALQITEIFLADLLVISIFGYYTFFRDTLKQGCTAQILWRFFWNIRWPKRFVCTNSTNDLSNKHQLCCRRKIWAFRATLHDFSGTFGPRAVCCTCLL